MKKPWLKILVGAAILLSVTRLAVSQMDKQTKDDLYSKIELFSYALTTVQTEYVDKIPAKDLIYNALKGMLAGLDPHSQFLPPEEYTELKTETEGKFGGLGIEISVRDGLLTVVSPIEDSPAWKAGVKAGDRIVKIEKELTRDLSLSDAVKKLRGTPGTDVHLTILRESEYRIFELKITRGIIEYQDVKNVQILEDKIGYIRLTEFREGSAKAFREGLEQLKALGADSLIVDLRNNPGGLLNIAIEITEDFLPKGQIIVSTKGRRTSQNSITYSNNDDHLIAWPMVVLINEGSASGSEIFAGAVKDNKRAILVGEKSFGKGSVQSVIPMPDGSGLRLTTSKYYTPSGISIHEIGIKPDVEVKYAAKEDEDDADLKGKERVDKKKKIEKVFDDVKKLEAEKNPQATQKTDKAKQDKEAREALLSDNQVIAGMNVLKGVRVYEKMGK
ncbi:MAG: S41 family peptidase [Candidatus Omnitrophica bacterium]|nr:S41 family peptidase [Candidatus Omnitrophota bacterium]